MTKVRAPKNRYILFEAEGNFSEEELKKGIYSVVNNSREFEDLLAQMENQDLTEKGQQALETVLDKRGSLECILKGLRPVIGH